jgi:hypothetical protein
LFSNANGKVETQTGLNQWFSTQWALVGFLNPAFKAPFDTTDRALAFVALSYSQVELDPLHYVGDGENSYDSKFRIEK